jgi:uncharacterized protein YdhG (YjbR/CyaY superfamily)
MPSAAANIGASSRRAKREPAVRRAGTKNPAAATTIDEYIAGSPKDVQVVLRRVRAAVRAAAPKAREVISYRMPALKQHGVLIYFAAFKRHIGFYPPIKGDSKLEKAAARYSGPKGNLRFPLDEPIPYGLITRLTRLRARQDAAAAKEAQRRR